MRTDWRSMTKNELATGIFKSGFNCAASVLAAFSEDYELEPDIAKKLTCAFGGGFHKGSICGALSGALCVVGLKYGQYIGDDLASRANCNAKAAQFTEKFIERNGALNCGELLDCDVTTEEGMEVLRQKVSFCADLVAGSAEILEELGY